MRPKEYTPLLLRQVDQKRWLFDRQMVVSRRLFEKHVKYEMAPCSLGGTKCKKDEITNHVTLSTLI